MIPWTRIQHRELAVEAVGAIKHYTKELCLSYHNFDHVVSMYQYFEDTNEPYDEVLDWAVLFHDIVYDKEGGKEKRSAAMFDFNARIPKYGIDVDIIPGVVELINLTEHHIVDNPSRSAIIRADLHGLTVPTTTIRNFLKIMEESCQLYKTTPSNFAKNSESFMDALYERVHGNITSDPSHEEFYRKVLGGIRTTTTLAKIVQQGDSA